jgi:hypothetical protein
VEPDRLPIPMSVEVLVKIREEDPEREPIA